MSVSTEDLTFRQARCASCGETFSTVANFDRHLNGDPGIPGCRAPAEVGLVDGRRGWHMPGPENPEKVGWKGRS